MICRGVSRYRPIFLTRPNPFHWACIELRSDAGLIGLRIGIQKEKFLFCSNWVVIMLVIRLLHSSFVTSTYQTVIVSKNVNGAWIPVISRIPSLVFESVFYCKPRYSKLHESPNHACTCLGDGNMLKECSTHPVVDVVMSSAVWFTELGLWSPSPARLKSFITRHAVAI